MTLIEKLKHEIDVLRIASAASKVAAELLEEAVTMADQNPEEAYRIYERAMRFSLTARGDASQLSSLDLEIIARKIAGELDAKTMG